MLNFLMPIHPYKLIFPQIAASTFVADNATVIGDVQIGEDCGIWFNAVIRGDVNYIRIGNNTNIQDGTVIHVATPSLYDDDKRRSGFPTLIGNNVTIGHMALIHACTIEDDCLIGMKSCLMDGVVVGQGSIIAAGSLVTPGKQIPARQLWAGSPARYMRDVTEQEYQDNLTSARHYMALMKNYLIDC